MESARQRNQIGGPSADNLVVVSSQSETPFQAEADVETYWSQTEIFSDPSFCRIGWNQLDNGN